ncbi:hypothetical protein J5N97_008153 [Dioscorea zingiberensis]|uniref:Transcription initiation factor TFIID subunit 8 n=1 Tax=Dioscorea zingiberensis TaxID=325984 RepID=A0A9D5DII7_9LILI|nr:hypothetical protein J5N97_008153 [Dioscorea zingiberensis]
MNDGGKESGQDNQNNNSTKKSSLPSPSSGGADDFSRSIAKIAVSQVCESAGFHGSRHSALDSLADILIQYIHDLSKASHFYANLSGRTACNVFDIIQGLKDLEAPRGFPGASDIHQCAVGSGVIKEITRFVDTYEENPFARPVPSFPIARQPKPITSFAQVGEATAGKHIPDWLPVFPDQHTYIHTPVWKERTSDPKADKIEQVRQRRKAEGSLLGLQQRLACNGAAMSAPAVDYIGKGKQVVGSNPFLAPPLPPGEKQVSEVVVPDEPAEGKRVSILETFAPAIEAAKQGSFIPNVSLKNRVLPSKRPTVHFKFGVDKNSIAMQVSSVAAGAKRDTWFLRDDEKDDKKRRAEMILKESMEKPDGLAQL